MKTSDCLDQRYIDFMISPGDVVMYVHRTRSQDVADKCLTQGFEHRENFAETTDLVGIETSLDDDRLERINLLHTQRTEGIGAYTVVLGISKEIIFKYMDLLLEIECDFNNETIQYGGGSMLSSPPEASRYTPNFLSEKPSFETTTDGSHKLTMYTLPPQYVKGWFNDRTGELVENPDYGPHYENEEAFLANIEGHRKDRAEQIAEMKTDYEEIMARIDNDPVPTASDSSSQVEFEDEGEWIS